MISTVLALFFALAAFVMLLKFLKSFFKTAAAAVLLFFALRAAFSFGIVDTIQALSAGKSIFSAPSSASDR